MEAVVHTFDEILLFIVTLNMVEITILTVNLVLMILARKIVDCVYQDKKNNKLKINHAHAFRALNAIIMATIAYYHITAQGDFDSIGFKLVLISLIIYFSYLTAHVLSFIIRSRYGKLREVEGSKRVIETYHSRLLCLLSGISIFIITLIAIIQTLDFESLLEAGGVVGFIGVFLALTQGAWAPDIFSGLIILNSGMVEEGDVIETSNGDSSIGVVYKTKVFHTEILNIVNNHRIMIKNAKLRDMTIHNLSKFASARGLRENIHFKISYGVPSKSIKEMFERSFERAKEASNISIECQYPLEISVVDTGDHAVEWVIYYYTKDVRNLIKTRQFFREQVLETSHEYSIDVSTPLTHQLQYTDAGKNGD